MRQRYFSILADRSYTLKDYTGEERQRMQMKLDAIKCYLIDPRILLFMEIEPDSNKVRKQLQSIHSIILKRKVDEYIRVIKSFIKEKDRPKLFVDIAQLYVMTKITPDNVDEWYNHLSTLKNLLIEGRINGTLTLKSRYFLCHYID